MTRRVLAGLALLAGGAALAAHAPSAAGLEVAPGTVVHWPGAELEDCSLGERHWRPRAGACWYTIDLLHPEGPIELVRVRAGETENATVRVSDYVYPVQHITLRDNSKVNLSQADLSRVRSEQQRVGALWSSDTDPQFELPLAPPLADLPEGGRFGARRFFNGQPRSPHSGADFAADAGTAVFSAAAGRVVLADDLFFSGQSVFIDHGAGLVTMYFHLSRHLVETGQWVERGEQIGAVGQTGRATGPHLHFGVRWRGARVDPKLLLGAGDDLPTIPVRRSG